MKADSNYFHVYAIHIFNYNLYEVGYDEEGESKLEDEDGDEDCLLFWSSRFIILFILLTKSSSVIGFLIKYRVESDRAFRKAMELAKLISKGGTGVEVSMLYVVHELVAPNRIFDHDLDIKSKITGERLTAKQYMKEVYQVMKLGAKTMF